jgi:antitoxin MazE
MAGAKAQLVKWGNSQAVRIPKTILEQCNLREGEELEIRVENGHIWLVPLSEKPTLKAVPAGFATTGVILSDAIRSVDWKARRARFIEIMPARPLKAVHGHLMLLLSLPEALV